jgi:cyclic lactone autoinducer peptide
MRKHFKLLVCMAALATTLLMAATSANACWIISIHQRECPKSLIKVD